MALMGHAVHGHSAGVKSRHMDLRMRQIFQKSKVEIPPFFYRANYTTF